MLQQLLVLLIFIPIFAGGEESFFHKELPYSTLSIDNALCQTCHTSSFKDNTTTVTHSDQNPIIPITHETANAGAFGADATSLACLNCHDGVFAPSAPVKLPSYLSVSSTQVATYDSIKSHPIFNTYPSKKELKSRGDSLPATWKNVKTVNDLLRDGKIVCISCHIPHHTKKKGFLRTTMSGSALCFGCHKK